VLLGNLTRHDQRIRIQLPGSSLAARMRMLDAGNLALALCEPESFRAQAGESLMTRAGIVELSLPPHALTTFEVAASPRQ
jgi:hypothetical protein